MEWEAKYDKVKKKKANEWAYKFNKMKETNDPIIQQLQESIKERDPQFAKWRPKVVELVGHLKIPYDICVDHAFNCK